MGLRSRKLWQSSMIVLEGTVGWRNRFYSSKPRPQVDLKKLKPMILKRIEDRAKEYPFKAMVPVAREVLKARALLHHGVSNVIQRIPVWVCKYCAELHVGEKGHLIRTCGGNRHRATNQLHGWAPGSLNDVLVPVETFHLQKMFQDVIKHDERFDFERSSAVVELCLQAGVDPDDELLHFNSSNLNVLRGNIIAGHSVESLLDSDMRLLARGTLRAWETLRSGVQKLLLVYPAKVCKHCSEVHVGPSGHKARLCGVFKYESWRGVHLWKKAEVDDIVPPKIVWCRRPQDPPVLKHEGRVYYGHAPAVVDICVKAGAILPLKYHCMVKVDGLSAPD